MSIESAKAFLERVKTDKDFRTSVGEIGTAEERLEYVKKAGFDFTMDEIVTVKDQLSDEDLAVIQGGGEDPVGSWFWCRGARYWDN